MKRALITGITGQDGSSLAEFLLSKGYEVPGQIRKICWKQSQRQAGLMNEGILPHKSMSVCNFMASLFSLRLSR